MRGPQRILVSLQASEALKITKNVSATLDSNADIAILAENGLTHVVKRDTMGTLLLDLLPSNAVEVLAHRVKSKLL